MTRRQPETSENVKRRNKAARSKPAGNVLLPAAAIGCLSLGLAAGLELLGMMVRVNDGIARIVSRGGAEKFPKQLPS